MENEVIDTQSTETPDIATTTPEQVTETPTQEPYTPFVSGKEKFKINGEEEEWDWETTKKYAQLGKAGQRAMEQRADLEKKHKTLYGQLVQAALNDVTKGDFQLYEVLTGKKHPHASGQVAQPNGLQAQDIDPKDLKIRELEEEVRRVGGQIEEWSVEKEKAAVAEELSSASKKYPEIKNPFVERAVKDEYRKALKNGLELSLEDVAFYVVQEWRKTGVQQQRAIEQKFEENKKRAPVIVPPAGEAGKKAMTLEDVKKLAGRL